MSTLTILSAVKLVHLLGLVMGLGGALLSDFIILTRGVIRRVTRYTIYQVVFLSHFVLFGLGILWVSGIALIAINSFEDPEYITNQKIWAKVAVVVVLTINGVLVHKTVLPFLFASVGRRLFDGVNAKQLAVLTFLGSVSLVSWSVPFVLAKASGLNYVTPMETILLVYAACVLIAWSGIYAVMSSVRYIQDLAVEPRPTDVQGGMSRKASMAITTRRQFTAQGNCAAVAAPEGT